MTAEDGFDIEPNELTLAFSVIDRNEPALDPAELQRYVNFGFYTLETDSDGQLETKYIKAAKCLDLYSDTFAQDKSYLS